jgi:hypothetical protein
VLAGSVKRKRLPDSVLARSYTAEKPRYSSTPTWLDRRDPPNAGLALVRSDDRGSSERRTGRSAGKAEFSLVPGAGPGDVHLPKDTAETSLPVSAVLAYVGAAPPKRILAAPIAEIDPGSEGAPPEPD